MTGRFVVWVLSAASWFAGPFAFGAETFDVVVYGGTAGGVVSAFAASREGRVVAIVEPRRHLGGMVSGGLGKTDFGKKETVGGLSLAFFERMGKHYHEPIAWFFEPSVAERTFEAMVAEAKIKVFRDAPLVSVDKRDSRIASTRHGGGLVVAGRVFIDATYEGDLLAMAGVDYHVGRESQATYGESLAGVRPVTPKHQFLVDVSGFDASGKLLPLIHDGPTGKPGDGDHKIQTYNFRLCMCDRPENQIPITRPDGYDPARFEVLARYLQARPQTKLSELLSIADMPNGKTDINNNGAVSTDHIGANWDYPEGDAATRERIWNDHLAYTKGLIYFLATDPRVPEHVRKAMNRYGYAKDEYASSGNFTHQLYVREARRMKGAYIMTERDCRTERTKPDSVGMGSYNIDTHNSQRIVNEQGIVKNEGDVQVPVQPYEIPYRCLTPRAEQCDNLLVPICLSSSHVAYGSIRMEPVYMLLGHACGLASDLAVEANSAVQAIDVPALQKKLVEQGQVLHYP